MLCIYLKMSIQYNTYNYNNVATNYINLAEYVMHISTNVYIVQYLYL